MQTEQLMELIVNLLVKLVFPVAAAVMVPALIKLFARWNAQIEKRIGETNYHLSVNAARDAVRSAEQVLGVGTGAKKKAMAAFVMDEICEQLGVPLTATQIDTLIEASVLDMNSYWLRTKSEEEEQGTNEE